MFSGSIFFDNNILSALKSCIVNVKKINFQLFLNFFWNKTVFLGLHTFSNVNILHEGLLLQDWVFRLGC